MGGGGRWSVDKNIHSNLPNISHLFGKLYDIAELCLQEDFSSQLVHRPQCRLDDSFLSITPPRGVSDHSSVSQG